MSLISKKNFILDEEDVLETEDYVLPDLVTTKPETISFQKSVSGSVALHIIVPVIIWLISIVLLLMGINLSLFNKVKPQPKRDIEFVLVDKPAKPRDPNTKNRADMDSRSGGVNDPNRKLSMPSPKPQKQAEPSAAANNANKIIKKQQEQVKKQVVQKPQAQPKPVEKPVKTEAPSPAKPAPPSVRPSTRPSAPPTSVQKPSTPFNVPAPKAAPIGKTLSTGPIGGTSAPSGVSKGSTGGPVTTSGAYAPKPSLSPSMSSGGGQLSRGSSAGGHGNVGNPGGGGGAPGIDALREPDFGPYMRELQRRIKLNWDPPKGNESKTVILLFKIARDGRLLSCRVHRSSGLPTADQAALKAVELTAPFRPLPGDFKGQSIDIQFTFDYRVFGASKY